MGLALAIPLIFGGLSPSSPIYQRSMAIGQMAARISAEQAAAQERACMNGVAPDVLRIVKAKGKARDLMADYWVQVKGGQSVNVSALFHAGVKPGWSTDDPARLASPADAGLKSDDARLAAHSDAFAVRGLTLDEARLNFILSGDMKSAIGQWVVLNSAGQISGLYDATFVQRKKAWRLTRLQWTGDRLGYSIPRQFCHMPGDVTPDRLAKAQSARIAAEESLIKAEARREKAEATLATTEPGPLLAIAEADANSAREAEAKARAAVEDAAYALSSAEDRARREAEEDQRTLNWDARRGI